MSPRIVAKLDPYWHRMNLTVSADALAGTDLLDQLAAAFAEDPERIAKQLLELAELNRLVESDVEAGREYSADATAGHANTVRDALAADLPVDVTVRLDEPEARALSADSLKAARSMFGRWNTGAIRRAAA